MTEERKTNEISYRRIDTDKIIKHFPEWFSLQ
jgi:hypothetical protein